MLEIPFVARPRLDGPYSETVLTMAVYAGDVPVFTRYYRPGEDYDPNEANWTKRLEYKIAREFAERLSDVLKED